MNDTAKKLREAADYMKSEGVASVVGDIRNTFAAIADELDELDDKAARRRSHIVKLESTIAERNRELRELRKRVPSEREREILDMWPKFEDGEPVMIGDGFMGYGGVNDVVELLDFEDDNVRLWGESGCDIDLGLKPVVKRPVQSVLDADGVEIHVGDTVWHCNGIASGVVTSIDAGSLMNTTRYVDESGTEFRDAARNLTHIAPDSWERLEEDAAKHPCVYAGGVKGGKFSKCSECPWGNECDGSRAGEMMARDVIRRAKALAGVEVD